MTDRDISPEALLDEMSRVIAESRVLLRQGAILELAGLDDQMRMLCESVLEMSKEEQLAYADPMQKMLEELKALGDEMMQARDTMAQEIRDISSHHRASVAYRTTENSDKSSK